MASGKWVNRGEVPYVIGFCRHYGANLIWNRALSPSPAERPSGKLQGYRFLQAIDCKRFGSANGGRTRIRRLLVFPLSY
jgi:hypothetical protein